MTLMTPPTYSYRQGRAIRKRCWRYCSAAGLLVAAIVYLVANAEIDIAHGEPPQGKQGGAAGEERISFATQILPILSDNCFACHGVDKETRAADLRLDRRESAVDEAAVIEPGHSAKSILIERITTKVKADQMPPAKFNKTLEPEEIELIKKWIDQGAEYQPHWAFVKPKQAPLPSVKQVDWPVNEIDRFVLARLEREGLSPSKAADKHALIRRVTLELTGLPPTHQEVDAFLKDSSPNAYEKVVDRLLASPRYGEHMTRYWLDAVRYGDTHGLHLDNYREMYPYRDWVISAFNQNMPFDRFTIEQIAGDLLDKPSLQQQVASGYNRCHVTTNEGGSIKEEVYVRNVIDRVETTGTVWLGMTTGCAVCHDHKYDPISQKEFYQLFAFFNSFDGNAMDGNNARHGPVVRVPSGELSQQVSDLDGQLKSLETSIAVAKKQAEPAFVAWMEKEHARLNQGSTTAEVPSKGLIMHLPLDENKGNRIGDQIQPKRQGTLHGKAKWTAGHEGNAIKIAGNDKIEFTKDDANFEQDQSFSYGAWIKTPGNVTGAPIAKMQDSAAYRGWDLYLVKRRVAMHLIHVWPNNSLKVTTKADVLKPNTWHHVFVTYDGTKKSSGVTIYVDGQPRPFEVNNDSLNGTTRSQAPFTLGRRTPGSPFTNGEIDEVRIYDRALSRQEVEAIAGGDGLSKLLAIAPDKRTGPQVQTLRQHYLTNVDKTYPALLSKRDLIQQQRKKLHDSAPTTLIFKETKEPRKAYLLHRGEYDQKRDEVGRDVPEFLPPMQDDMPRSRLGFAQWLVHPDHPLTARVTVNRFWQQLFGTGLVKTSEDFGVQGEQPSHPELIDWLAVQMIKDGWDIKATMKRMVMSATYRQTAAVSADLYKTDPDNRLLARGPRLRLDAEVLRDQALAVSGLLNNEIGGASVKPPQPGGIWRAVGYESSNTANFRADSGDKVYRRSMYIFWKRTAPPPYMVALDAPNRESCVVRRERTNTPMQALVILNEPQYVESARRLGERVMQQAEGDAKRRIVWLFERTLMRPPTEAELSILTDGFDEQLTHYRGDIEAAKQLIASGTSKPDATLDPAELAAWTMTASTLINLDEFINKP